MVGGIFLVTNAKTVEKNQTLHNTALVPLKVNKICLDSLEI